MSEALIINHKEPHLTELIAQLFGGFRVAFRKQTADESIYSKIIRLWPFGGAAGLYSHVEIQFSNGWCWSSDEADGGSRFRKLNITPENWDWFFIPCSRAEERIVWEFCERENGLDYDKRGIVFSFLPIPIGWQHPENWFCSEACTAAIQLLGYLTGHTPASIAPSRMAKLLGKSLRLKNEQRITN